DSTGIAPGANLIDVRVMNADGTGTVADTLMGINWVIYNARALNIKVMNLSLAAASTDPWDYDPLCAAVRAATAAGITVVVAAGNYGNAGGGKLRYGSVASPANDPTVITVGAVNFKATVARNDDGVTRFSSRGPTRSYLDMGTHKWYDNIIKPDLVAPGNRVVGASATSANSGAPANNRLATLHPSLVTAAGGGTVYAQRVLQLSGTSVAAPAVAGAAAVLLQANPGLTPPLVKAILQYSAQPLPGQSLVDQGAGQLNVEGAVRIARTLRPDISTALRNGTLVAGSTSLLAAGRSLPSPRSNVIGGQTVNWSRIVTVGGNRIATGDTLFTRWQPVWDPRLAWASEFAI
ncbi:MAG: S8 family serine peptidase, partial [Rubrivivax sp.]